MACSTRSVRITSVLRCDSPAQAVIRRGRFCPAPVVSLDRRLRGSNRQATVGRSFGDRCVHVRYIILSGISAARFDCRTTTLDTDKLKRRWKTGTGRSVVSRWRDRATVCSDTVVADRADRNGRCK